MKSDSIKTYSYRVSQASKSDLITLRKLPLQAIPFPLIFRVQIIISLLYTAAILKISV
jgi:hypothetical protein